MNRHIRRLVSCAAALTALLNCSFPAGAVDDRLYNQYDPYWKTIVMESKYGTKNSMYSSACGIFSFCNAIYGLNSTELDAIEVAEWARDNGTYTPGHGGTNAPKMVTYVQEKWGEAAHFQLKDAFYSNVKKVKDERLISHLKAGGVAQIHVKNHYMAIIGYDEENALYHVIESACSSSRGLAGSSWVTAEKMMSDNTSADWFALYENTKPPERASVSCRKVSSAEDAICFTLDSDIKGAFTLGIFDDAENRRITSYSHQAAIGATQKLYQNVPEAGIYTAYTTSSNDFGFCNSEPFTFQVYDHAPETAVLSLQTEPLKSGEPAQFTVTGDPAESYTIEIHDLTQDTVFTETKETDLSAWAGDTEAYQWTPQRPGHYTAKVTVHNDYGDLVSEQISFCVEGDLTVTLDAAGGSVPQKTLNVPFEGVYGELPDAERENYVFAGWFNLNGEQITPETPVPGNADHTLCAHWISVMPGDVNRDSVTDVRDAVLLCRIVTEDDGVCSDDPDALPLADLDGDEMLTVQDLILLLEKLNQTGTDA